jgi:hypothetical protein
MNIAGPVKLRLYLAIALDIVIAIYALALVVILATGGIDLSWFRATDPSRPILVLWTLVPIRVTLYLLQRRTHPVSDISARVRQAIQSIADRIPPAVRDVAFAFVVTRTGSLTIGFFVNLLYPSERTRPFDLPFDIAKLAEIFAAWDSGWYFDIASRGYYYSEDGQSSIAFFPLYPMAMRALAWPFGSSDAAVWAAGIAISLSSFLAGLIVLHRYTHRLFGDRDIARRTVLYVSVFPFSFFLARVYPSGLFFLLTVLAVSAASQSRWWQAGIWGGLAALTRPQGILIAVPLALMAMRGADRRAIVTRVTALMPIPIAFAGYNLYITMLSGDLFAWLSSESRWGYTLGNPPWEQLLGLIARVTRYGVYDYFFTSNLAAYHLIQGVTALVLVAALPAVFVRLGVPLGGYVLVSLLVPLSGNALEGIGRYSAVLFPVFMLLATIKSPRFHEAYLILSSLFLALFVGLFATWRPIY